MLLMQAACWHGPSGRLHTAVTADGSRPTRQPPRRNVAPPVAPQVYTVRGIKVL